MINILPARLAEPISKACEGKAVEEIRLRVARPPQVITQSSDAIAEAAPFTRDEASELLERLCRHSVYAVEEELKRGYLTFEGGSRVGVCGRPVTEAGRVVRLTEVTGFNIRINREIIGCAERIMGYLTEKGRPVSSLIASPPAGGKTTLLRDISRCFSDGVGASAVKVAIADERGEIAGCINGAPSFCVGTRTDVMEFAPKAQAIEMLVRSMSPDIIITDEIGGEGDSNALAEAARCGVAVIASVHASSFEELIKRKAMESCIKEGVFKRVLMLRRSGSMLHISPLKL